MHSYVHTHKSIKLTGSGQITILRSFILAITPRMFLQLGGKYIHRSYLSCDYLL